MAPHGSKRCGMNIPEQISLAIPGQGTQSGIVNLTNGGGTDMPLLEQCQ